MQYEEDSENYPLAYSIDNAILMHRDAHFAGNFGLMLDYYLKEGKGTQNDFDIPKIQSMIEMELKAGKNLSPLLLSGAEAEKVAQARQAYKNLKSLYETKNTPKSLYPRLIADLILAEDEQNSLEALEAVVAQKSAIVPALVDLLRSEDFSDPLFPGYGLAPALAAECLGRIGDKRALISLFETIGNGDFFNEDIILNAIHAIGTPAKEFLLKVMHARPITGDNEHAAIALVLFKDDPEVTLACLKMLHEIDLKKYELLATYLILICEGLPHANQQDLLKIAEDPNTPKMIRQDILTIAKTWT